MQLKRLLAEKRQRQLLVLETRHFDPIAKSNMNVYTAKIF